jgi:hypothetical protein
MSDEFGNYIEERKERVSNFRKTEFLRLDEGEKIIRILDGHEVRIYTHYVGYAYVLCLGDECPICQNNKKILFEHPTDYRDVKGWNPRKDRYYINVLDRTKMKVCDKCKTEAPSTAEVCPACGTVLGEAKPLEKVKVLTGGSKLFEDLKVLSRTVRDDDSEERVDIRAYDWLLVTRGKKLDKVTSPSPRYNPAKAGILTLTEGQELFDLQKSVITLTPEEMIDVWDGGASLKDVFAVRRAKKETTTAEFESPMTEVSEDIQDSLDLIFKRG